MLMYPETAEIRDDGGFERMNTHCNVMDGVALSGLAQRYCECCASGELRAAAPAVLSDTHGLVEDTLCTLRYTRVGQAHR